MTAQFPSSAFRSGEADFCTLRSRFIDAFARLELAVRLCLHALDSAASPRKTTFTQCVTELSKTKPSAKLSTGKATSLATLAQDCEPLQRLRASVVQGVMETGLKNGEQIALFRNVADILSNNLICHVLTVSDFRKKIEDLDSMTHRVENSPNRPFSATGDAAAKPPTDYITS
jgi:hypothetical protein